MNKNSKKQKITKKINPDKNSEMKFKVNLNDENDEDFIQHQEKVSRLLNRLQEAKSTFQ